jgi:hypothetical protein
MSHHLKLELSKQASEAILLAESNLHNFPDLEFEDQKERMDNFRKLWLVHFQDIYQKTSSSSDNESLSLHELLWLAWAGCYLLTKKESRRTFSKQEAINLHGRVKMITREWNDFGYEHAPRMKELEHDCASLAFYGPSSDPVPPKANNQGIQLDDEKRTFLIQVDQNIDFETPYRDHRRPEHKGSVRLYAPKRWSHCLFVSDVCRLFFWSQQCAQLFASAKLVEKAEVDEWKIQQTRQLIQNQTLVMCTTEIESAAALLYYRLNLPMGALHAYNRNVRVSGDAFTAISYDCGNQHIRALTEHLTSHPDIALSTASRFPHPMRDAWIWTLWDRLLRSSQAEWFQDYMCCTENLVQQQPILLSRFKWRVHRRSPIIIHMIGYYWIQWVHPELKDFVLWQCQDAFHAISVWCDLMHKHHQGLTLNRSDLNPILKMVLKAQE